MKKYLILILTMSMIFNIGILNFAAENHTTNLHINEYEILKNLNENQLNKINEVLSVSGSTEINTLQNGNFTNPASHQKVTKKDLIENYKAKIYKLKEWNTDQLKNVGYNPSQIAAIKAFDGSEEMMMLAATSVDVNIGLRNISYTSSGTTVKVIADFNCEGIQSNWFLDVFAVTWSSPLTITSKTGSVRYTNSYGESKTYTHSPVNDGNLYGLGIKFYKYKDSVGQDFNHALYVHSGSIIINLKSNTNVPDIAALASYGYNTLSTSPSFAISAGGPSGGISFSSHISSAGEAYTSN